MKQVRITPFAEHYWLYATAFQVSLGISLLYPVLVGIRALDRREQMIDDLIEGDVPPDVHRPQHRKDQKSKHQCQNSYADYP